LDRPMWASRPVARGRRHRLHTWGGGLLRGGTLLNALGGLHWVEPRFPTG